MTYIFEAKVIRGKGRGRRLGFPTANLNKKKLKINYGVYLVEVKMKEKFYQGLLHFGPRKTFGEPVSLELYIKNFKGNLYRQSLKVKVLKKIRGIKKFKNAKELKNQLNQDLKFL